MARFEAGQVVHHRLSGEKLVVVDHQRSAGAQPDRVVCQWWAHNDWREQAFTPDELLAGRRDPEQ